MTRGVSASSGGLFPAFPKGGKMRRLVVGSTWREFDPMGVDLFRIHIPETSAGRVIYTSTTDVPDLVDGAAVTPQHRDLAPTYYAGTWHECLDRSGSEPRFFWALDGAAPGETAVLLFEGAAS